VTVGEGGEGSEGGAVNDGLGEIASASGKGLERMSSGSAKATGRKKEGVWILGRNLRLCEKVRADPQGRPSRYLGEKFHLLKPTRMTRRKKHIKGARPPGLAPRSLMRRSEKIPRKVRDEGEPVRVPSTRASLLFRRTASERNLQKWKRRAGTLSFEVARD